MYIKQNINKINKQRVVSKELNDARLMGPLAEPVCTDNCPAYNPSVGCHRLCQKAPLFLSSEPDSYPLDILVSPLVFEIKKLGIFEPCWSCEGHNDPSGNLWKIPRIWFYANSVVHIRVLADAIMQIYTKIGLNTKWVVEITHSDNDNPDTTFSLHPKIENDDIDLKKLQADLETVHSNIAEQFRKSCDQLLDNAS